MLAYFLWWCCIFIVGLKIELYKSSHLIFKQIHQHLKFSIDYFLVEMDGFEIFSYEWKFSFLPFLPFVMLVPIASTKIITTYEKMKMMKAIRCCENIIAT
jgi:hypothetical protein